MSIGSAIVNRWNAVGFGSSIAKLRLGAPRSPSVKDSSQNPTTGSDPEGTPLPRAEYVLLDSMIEAETSGCVIHEQPFFIYVRRPLSEATTLVENLKQIRLAIHNSTNSPTNPFNMGVAQDDEKATSIKFVGSQFYPQHPNIIEGEIAFSCRFTTRNSVPTS